VLRRAISDVGDGPELDRPGIGTPSPIREEPLPSRNAPVLSPARYVLLPLAQMLTGYSVKAMQRKIERGDWQEGKVWKHAPDGHVVIDMVGYHKWVENP
jgi:hypothetical protein